MGLTNLDFARRAPPLAGWRLALLASGLLALAATSANWMVQTRAAGALEGQLARAQPRIVRTAALGPAQIKAQEQKLRSVAEAVRQLNLPVARLVRTIQAPPDIRVALLGLDLAGKPDAGGPAGSLKISAEAETAQDMMNYVAYLNEQPLFTSVYLVKHEMRSSAPGRPYRFQLEAQWEE